MDKNKNYLLLKKAAEGLGAQIFGVADISIIKNEFALSPKLKEKLSRAICLGVSLSSGILEEIENQPTKLYFHHYRALNNALDQLALRLSNFIQEKSSLSLPIPASIILDWENQRAHLSHKAIGRLAGLGWIGRNNLLVNERLGSRFRIVTILTDMPLKADKPVKKDCGSCRLCVAVCPAQAIKEKPEDFDHIRCFEKLKDFQKQRLVDQYICGVCVRVCNGKIKR